MKKILFLLIVGVGIIFTATSVSAAPFTFPLDIQFSDDGTDPKGPTPWLTATFVDIAPNQVQLTMEAPGLTDNEFVSVWYFNFDPEYINVGSSFDVTFLGPVTITDGGIGRNSYQANGDSGDGFDIFFGFATENNLNNGDDRFTEGKSSVVTFTGNMSELGEPLTVDFFKFLNEPEKGSGTFYSAAHVQGISEGDIAALVQGIGEDEDDGASGWIGATEVMPAIPEPGTFLLLGAGLASLFGIRRFKFKK